MTGLKEIEKRMKGIKSEMENENADINALTEETDRLIEERKNILSGIERRKALLDKIAVGDAGEGMPAINEKQEPETRGYTRESAEYRSAFLKNIRGIELTGVERRAFSSASDSAGAVIPTQTANEIIKKMKQIAPLLGEITLLNVTGNVRFAVEDTIADPTLHSENASITAATDKLSTVTLGAYEITKLVQVSKTVATMSIDAFESWLTDMLAEKLTEKICLYLISGTGTSQPQGVGSSNEWGETNSVTVAKTGSLSATNVQNLIGLLNGAYDRNAKFLMSKKTLFNDFMPLQDNSKNSIVRTEGQNFYIYGYPVLLDDNITIHEAFLGDFKKIVGNLSEAINIVSGFDIDTNSYKYLGCAMFDSKVADKKAFVKLAKATA